MGRGRAKAKQTKVARELKYSSPGMDLSRLQRDLHSEAPAGHLPAADPPEEDDDPDADPYADPYADLDDELGDTDERAGSAAS